jgi:hypothetical protein
MKNQQRIFSNVYTIPITVTAGVVNNASTPIYFSGYTSMRGKTIKAITFDIDFVGITQLDYFLTMVNGNGEQLIYNMPFNNFIMQTDVIVLPYNRLPLFNLYDVDLLRSYWMNSQGIAYTFTGTLFRLNFYWE